MTRPAAHAGRVAGSGQPTRPRSGLANTASSGGSIHWSRTLAVKRDARLIAEHLQFKPQARSSDAMHCVLLDCSASMMSAGHLALAKGVLLSLSQQLYRRRDSLAVIGFGGETVSVLQHARRASVSDIEWIESIEGGGGSPVLGAVEQAERMLHTEKRRQGRYTKLWLFSDGRYDPLPFLPRQVDESHVVDFESGYLMLGRIRQLAELWHAQYTHASHWVDVNANPNH